MNPNEKNPCEVEIPNLDAMGEEALLMFWGTHHNSKTPDLAHAAIYANMRRTAMQCRVRGRVMQAQMFEEMCDEIYKKISDINRW